MAAPVTSLVVESGGRIVAFAGFYRDPASQNRAEVAFAVSDALQGHGIGTRLLERLASIAREQGVKTFDAYVLGDNRRMLDVFRDSGFAVTTKVESGVCHVVVSLSVTDRLRGQGGRQVARGGDGVDESLLRAARRRRRRRQSRTRQDRIGDPAQPRGCGLYGHDRARASDGAGRSKGSPPTRA